MNNYMKLLADLANVDKVNKDEDNALILLSSLSDDKIWDIRSDLNQCKQSLSYNDVLATPVNHEVRRKDK